MEERESEVSRLLTLDRGYAGLQLIPQLFLHMQLPEELPGPVELPVPVSEAQSHQNRNP
jgi:hypothetical protein